jgi:L-lactate dehydrogenase complex protein LldG
MSPPKPPSPPAPLIAMSRSAIFAKIRAALEPVPERAAMPDYEASAMVSESRLEGDSVNGRAMSSPAELVALLREQGHTRGYCDPALMDPVGKALAAAGLEVLTDYDRGRYDDYQFGITRATGAIAESGSLILDDARTSDRLAALSPWVHVAVLSSREVHRTIPEALAALGPSRNVIWVTGPSKTADVEGILIEGVHGPGEQVALFLD